MLTRPQFAVGMLGWSLLSAASALVAIAIAGRAQAQDPLMTGAGWASPTYEQVRAQVIAWLAEQPIEDQLRQELQQQWPEEGGRLDEGQLLDKLAVTFARVLPEAHQIWQVCQMDRPPLPLPQWSLWAEGRKEDWVTKSMRVYLARWLVQQQLYDEALEVAGALRPEEVVAPATLLFYQSVAHHKLLHKDECLPLLARLLARESSIPRRYRDVARLMAADLTPLRPDTLDEVSRLMDDIRRRLDFGRAGRVVRKQEDDVIAKLDKMIEDLEKQLQQQQGGGAGGGNLQPTQPAQDSAPLGGSGPGNVGQRDIGRGSGWGNLPPREREEALQEITKNLPSHYRSVIEEYFRKLARTPN